jgi:hypothetical protein
MVQRSERQGLKQQGYGFIYLWHAASQSGWVEDQPFIGPIWTFPPSAMKLQGESGSASELFRKDGGLCVQIDATSVFTLCCNAANGGLNYV